MKSFDNDDELADALAESDVEAQEAYFARFSLPLIKFAIKSGFSEADAEDLAQETLAKGVELIGSFIRGEVMVRWLAGIERNFMKREWARRAEANIGPLDPVADAAAAQRRLNQLTTEEKRDLAKLWAYYQLYAPLVKNKKHIAALELRYLDQLDYADIQAALGLGEGSARVYVQRGLADLKKMFEADPPEDPRAPAG